LKTARDFVIIYKSQIFELKEMEMNEKPTNDKNVNFREPGFNFSKWFDNFWYHYKVHTIIAIVVIITVAISTVQLLTKENFDFYTMYAGPQVLAVQDIAYIQKGIGEFATDYNGDGQVKVALNDIVMLSSEELVAAQENGAVFNGEFLQKTMTQYYQQIIAGDVVICFLSPYMYEIVHKDGGFMTLAEIYGGDIPETAYDDCGIILSDTDFGKSFNGIDDLPENTIMCIRKVSTLKTLKGSEKTEEHHAAYVGLFKAMADYKSN